MSVRREDFSIPPKPDRGDVDRDAIHLAAGQALNNWEKVEYFFGELYAAVLGAVVPVGALRAFGSVSAFSNRQTMLMEAADALWHWGFVRLAHDRQFVGAMPGPSGLQRRSNDSSSPA